MAAVRVVSFNLLRLQQGLCLLEEDVENYSVLAGLPYVVKRRVGAAQGGKSSVRLAVGVFSCP